MRKSVRHDFDKKKDPQAELAMMMLSGLDKPVRLRIVGAILWAEAEIAGDGDHFEYEMGTTNGDIKIELNKVD